MLKPGLTLLIPESVPLASMLSTWLLRKMPVAVWYIFSEVQNWHDGSREVSMGQPTQINIGMDNNCIIIKPNIHVKLSRRKS